MFDRNKQQDLEKLAGYIIENLDLTGGPADWYVRFTINGVEEIMGVLGGFEGLEENEDARLYVKHLVENPNLFKTKGKNNAS